MKLSRPATVWEKLTLWDAVPPVVVAVFWGVLNVHCGGKSPDPQMVDRVGRFAEDLAECRIAAKAVDAGSDPWAVYDPCAAAARLNAESRAAGKP